MLLRALSRPFLDKEFKVSHTISTAHFPLCPLEDNSGAMVTLWITFLLLGPLGTDALEDEGRSRRGGTGIDDEAAGWLRHAVSPRPEVAEAARRDLEALRLDAVPALEAHLQDPFARMIVVDAIEAICDQGITVLARQGMEAPSETERARLEAGFDRAGPAAASTLARVVLYGRGNRRAVASELWSRLVPPEDEAAWTRLRGLVPLSAPLLSHLARGEDPPGRAAAALRRAAEEEVGRLDSNTYGEREEAAEVLFRMGDTAEPVLREASLSGDPHISHAAGRTLQQIRWGISTSLARKIGDRLEGYEKREWRERRAEIHRLQRLGGEEAVPALRRILEAETSERVREFAAVSLARMGDPVGIAHLEALDLRMRYLIPLVTVGIYMDQGLRYLREEMYERAVAEFLKILEIDPEEELAYYNLACAYSLWGRTGEAMEALRGALENGFDDFDHMIKDEDLDPIRDEESYRKLIEKHGGWLEKPGESGSDRQE